jgi:hypothetical protein
VPWLLPTAGYNRVLMSEEAAQQERGIKRKTFTEYIKTYASTAQLLALESHDLLTPFNARFQLVWQLGAGDLKYALEKSCDYYIEVLPRLTSTNIVGACFVHHPCVRGECVCVCVCVCVCACACVHM